MSRNGLHEPNREPCTRCSNTVVTWPRSCTSPSCARSPSAVSTSVAPLPRHAVAPVMTSGPIFPTVTTTTSAPVPRDSSRASRAASPASATVCVAPTVAANSRFIATGSTPTTCSAPACRAPCTAFTPTPPRPRTTTVSPGRTPPEYTADPHPVGTLQASSAAVSSATCGSRRTQENSDSSECRAKAPTMQNPPSGSPSRVNGQRPLGSCPVAMVAPLSHRLDRPAAQKRQCPQAGRKLVTTLSPGCTAVPPSPTARTTPEPSWPPTIGYRPPGLLCRRCSSEWHSPAKAISTSTSPGPGSATSSSTTSYSRSGACSSAAVVLTAPSCPGAGRRPPTGSVPRSAAACGTIGGGPPPRPPPPPAAPPPAGAPATVVCPGCGCVLGPVEGDGAAHPGAFAACARLFEVTLRGLRDDGADRATAAI